MTCTICASPTCLDECLPQVGTLPCTFEEFKCLAKEFNDAASTMNIHELDNAWKCLGLAYLGMYESMWQYSAASVLRMSTETFLACERELENENRSD